MRFLTQLVFVLAIFATYRMASGQVDNQPLPHAQWHIAEGQEYRVHFELDGQAQITLQAVIRFAIPLDLMYALNNASVQKDLELGELQKAKIADAVYQLQQLYRVIIGEAYINGVVATAKLPWNSRAMDVAADAFIGSVSAGQLERLHEILLQCEIRRVGLLAELCYGRLQRPLGISSEQRRELHAAYFDTLKSLQSEINELQNKTVDDFWQCLSPEQRDSFERKICPHDAIPRIPLFYMAHTTRPEVLEAMDRRYGGQSIARRPYSLLAFDNRLRLRLDGQLSIDESLDFLLRIDDVSLARVLDLLVSNTPRDFSC